MIYRSTGCKTYASRGTRPVANHESPMGSFMEMAGLQCLTGIAQWSSRPCIEGNGRWLVRYSETNRFGIAILPSLLAVARARFAGIFKSTGKWPMTIRPGGIETPFAASSSIIQPKHHPPASPSIIHKQHSTHSTKIFPHSSTVQPTVRIRRIFHLACLQTLEFSTPSTVISEKISYTFVQYLKVIHPKMSSVSSSSSNIASLCISDTTSLSSSSSFDSFVFYPIEVAKPRLSKRTPVKTIIEQNLPHSSMSQLIVCLAGTSSGSLEEQIDSIRDYIYLGDAASYLEQYRKPSSLRAKRHAESLIKSIKKCTPLVNWKPSHSDLNQSSQLSLLFPGDLVPETTMREPNTRKSRGTTNHLTIRLKNSEILAIPPPVAIISIKFSGKRN
ncbi:hypothetical protein H4Q26_012632 [Puccinia striiformis f. sp. tritici PST-130]|nr:hypothetical protein H4Q26_012632 [Puccinia striiformis f. sp. tritici PST-130]